MIDEAIQKIFIKALEARILPKLDAIEREIRALKESKKEKVFEEKMCFLLPEEAEERLKMSRPTLNKLLKSGKLKTQISPGGRVKILESSLNEYIRTEAGA